MPVIVYRFFKKNTTLDVRDDCDILVENIRPILKKLPASYRGVAANVLPTYKSIRSSLIELDSTLRFSSCDYKIVHGMIDEIIAAGLNQVLFVDEYSFIKCNPKIHAKIEKAFKKAFYSVRTSRSFLKRVSL